MHNPNFSGIGNSSAVQPIPDTNPSPYRSSTPDLKMTLSLPLA